ncbi:MAG: ParB N-terminal domain-containing protein [Lachnospiraceae bacterium]|nr:ParB N-terminal domain-containing protein [Lachnospiraceae bacterium]
MADKNLKEYTVVTGNADSENAPVSTVTLKTGTENIENGTIAQYTYDKFEAGMAAGGVIGAVDSWAGGNELPQILDDALKGALTGTFCGGVMSAFANFLPELEVALKIQPIAGVILGYFGIKDSFDNGHGKQAVIRTLLTLPSIIGSAGVFKDIKLTKFGSKSGSIPNKYQKASLWERLTTKKANVNDLHANPLDEFSNPRIGPSESAVAKYMKEINTTGKLSKPIEVQKLSTGGYEIVNGHHRWLAAQKVGLEKVPIQIKNYNN